MLVSSKKSGKALVSFQHTTNTVSDIYTIIIMYNLWLAGCLQLSTLESGIGVSTNPLTISWVSGAPSTTDGSVPGGDVGTSVPVQSVKSVPVRSVRGVESVDDYESLTLMRLRQAEEKKRLNQQLLQEQQEPSWTISLARY